MSLNNRLVFRFVEILHVFLYFVKTNMSAPVFWHVKSAVND